MIEITMPRLSDTMEEGAIATWHKKPGDSVEIGDVLVEIETDKATMEYEAYEAGTMSKILVEEGENVAIGTPIALVDDGSGEGESHDVPSDTTADKDEKTKSSASKDADDSKEGAKKAAESKDDQSKDESEAPAKSAEPSSTSAETDASNGERQFASPYVRKLSRDHNLDLSKVTGSGPGGRIIRTDLDTLLDSDTQAKAGASQADAGKTEKAAPSAKAAPTAEGAQSVDEKRGSESVPLSRTRRVIAKRLGESARSIPHFYVTAAADAEALMQLRAQMNEQLVASGRPKVSVNDLLVKACAIALREHPLVNASYIDDSSSSMQVHNKVNIGVAVASENGLMVPVIENADQKSVSKLGSETKELVAAANDKKLALDQMAGGTFTISNLGMFGVEEFTAIINPPEGAILAVGGTKREPTVVGDEIVAHYRMRYTLSADHRIVDGALAAQFLQTLTRLVENPWSILA